MSLTPISTITTDIQSQPEWSAVRDWGLIIRAWDTAVAPPISSRSRPKSLSHGQILTIATNSASLAHQLTFGRKALCLQLNRLLAVPILDLRFVPIGYVHSTTATPTETQSNSIIKGEIVICSNCSCRCREGELLRWTVCQFCAIDLGLLGKGFSH